MSIPYAGIGSRETPNDICAMMTLISRNLAKTGWKLRSGHALGADQAFEKGTALKEVYLPWDGYNGAYADGHTHGVIHPTDEIRSIAAHYHPAWGRLTEPVRLLMCRNVTIILGEHLVEPSLMVICWTPNGQWIGGTSHGLRIAEAYGIPIFNLALTDDQTKLSKFVLQR